MSRKFSAFLLVWGLVAVAPILQARYKTKPFSVSHAKTFAATDSHDGITIAAEPYDQPEKIRQVFDADLLRAGYVAVLVVVSNDSDNEIRVDGNSIELTGSHVDSIWPTPTDTVLQDVFFGKHRIRSGAPPIGIGIPGRGGSSRVGNKDFENARTDFLTKELGDKFVPAHSTAYGFLFYEARNLVGRKVYIPDVRITRSSDPKRVGHALLFFEVDLKPAFQGRP